MARQVIWTKQTLEFFLEHSGVNEFQKQIMVTRCQNMTVVQQAQLLNCSESTVHKEIAKIKKIYDVVQKEHPDQLPPRKASQKELYMDTH